MRLLIAPISSGLPYLTYYPATAVAAYFGGLGPGIVVAVAGSVIAGGVFIPAANSMMDVVVPSAVYLMAEVMLCAAIHGLHVANERYRQALVEVERARGEAEVANESKSRFLAAASHDLRQPFQAMRLFYDLLDAKLAEPGQRQALSLMGRAMVTAESLLNELLDIARLDARQTRVNLVQVVPSQVISEVLSELAPVAAGRQLALRTCRGCVDVVETDPLLLKRILFNLVTNAIRYTNKGGVLVGTRRRQDCVVVEVWDTGVGIPADQLDMIFEEFYRIGNEARNADQGLGLGLAIVRRLCALLNYRISASSRTGKGTVFRVTIPLRPVGKATAPAACT